jgi:hypothetical protein
MLNKMTIEEFRKHDWKLVHMDLFLNKHKIANRDIRYYVFALKIKLKMQNDKSKDVDRLI